MSPDAQLILRTQLARHAPAGMWRLRERRATGKVDYREGRPNGKLCKPGGACMRADLLAFPAQGTVQTQ
jgi:hypothetical protein